MRVRTRLPPWRRSADRACLRVDSLLAGNFTGNIAILVDRRHDLSPETLHRSEVNSLLQLTGKAFGRAGYREDTTAKSVGNSGWLSLSALQSAVVLSRRPPSAQTVLSARGANIALAAFLWPFVRTRPTVPLANGRWTQLLAPGFQTPTLAATS
jgi:hypothetical protein